MKTITYTKTTEPAFTVEAKVDIEDSVAEVQDPSFERITTIMETKGLTDAAVSQGLDLTKKTERSFKALIEMGKSIAGTSISLQDNEASLSVVLHTAE